MTDTASAPDEVDPVRLWLADCHRTLGRMPYGGIARFERVDLGTTTYGGTPPRPRMSNAELARHLATNLERLRVLLTRVAASNEKTVAELRDLRRQVAGLDELADSIARYRLAAHLEDGDEDGDGEWDGTLPHDVTTSPAPIEAGS